MTQQHDSHDPNSLSPELEHEVSQMTDCIVISAIKTMSAGFRKWANAVDAITDNSVSSAHEAVMQQAAKLNAERAGLQQQAQHATGLSLVALRARIAQIDAIEAAAVARLDAAAQVAVSAPALAATMMLPAPPPPVTSRGGRGTKARSEVTKAIEKLNGTAH